MPRTYGIVVVLVRLWLHEPANYVILRESGEREIGKGHTAVVSVHERPCAVRTPRARACACDAQPMAMIRRPGMAAASGRRNGTCTVRCRSSRSILSASSLDECECDGDRNEDGQSISPPTTGTLPFGAERACEDRGTTATGRVAIAPAGVTGRLGGRTVAARRTKSREGRRTVR